MGEKQKKHQKGNEDRTETSQKPILIRKYANRRLYNVEASSYVTLRDLAEIVRQGTEFTVSDAKTGEDITHVILAQIILDQESKGENLLPARFLRKLICMYDDSVRHIVPGYLEMCLECFAREQKLVSDSLTSWSDFSLEAIHLQIQQNLKLFRQAVAGTGNGGEEKTQTERDSPTAIEKNSDPEGEVEELRKKIEILSDRLDRLNRE